MSAPGRYCCKSILSMLARKYRSIWRICIADSEIEPLMTAPPRGAVESADRCLHNCFEQFTWLCELPIPNQPASHHVSWRSTNAQVRAKTAMRSKHKHQESMNLPAITGVAGRAYAAQIAKERSA